MRNHSPPNYRGSVKTRPRRQARLQKLVLAQPDATLAELGTRLDRPFGTSTIDLWLRRLGLTYKKNTARRRTEPPRRGGEKGVLA